jgi:hypothetical protein
MSEQSLITRNDGAFTVAFTPEAEASKLTALESAALIGRVTDATENENAVAAQKEVARVLKSVEDARVAAKKPVLDFGRTIDDAARKFIADLRAEEMRLARLVGDFQQLEMAKTRAAEALRIAELNVIERRTQEELQKAKSHDEIDSIQARASQEAAALPIIQPVKAQGQFVREDWNIIVTDVWALARAHPMCVTVEPRKSEIRQLLDAGITPAGVKAEKVTKSSVRLGREMKAIEA